MKKITYSILVAIPLLFNACANKEQQTVSLDSNYKEKLSYLKSKYVEKNEVKITKETFQEPDKFYTHIVVAPTKMNDRLEWFLEKATEIGVHEITPIICDHSERKVYKIDRAEKIIQAAMKQSLHYYIPKINEPISFAQFVKSNFEGQKFIAHCEETDKKSLKSVLKPNQNIIMLIGPEGDFSEKEITLALENDFTAVSLGNTRLRTETAAIVACHSVVFVNED